MKKQHKHPKGAVSVFLCMIFTLILSLIIIVLELTRTQAMKAHLDGISHISMESSQGYFSLPLLEEYGLFSIHKSDSQIQSLIHSYTYNNLNGISNFFQTASFDTQLLKTHHLTDDDGKIFSSQVCRYMKYYSCAEITNFVLNLTSLKNFSKDYIDLKNIDTDSTEFDSSLPLNEFSDDAIQENIPEEENANARKKSILSKIKEFMTDSSLLLYISDHTKISQSIVETKELPSHTCTYKDNNAFLSSSEKALFLTYLTNYFSNYTTVEEDEHRLAYQLEYLLYGDCSDDQNLLSNIKRIQKLRTQLNLAYLYTDYQKRSQAKTLAYAAVGSIPVPFLVEFTQLSLLSAWAYAEAILDVRALLKNEKIPLFKSSSTWTLNLDDLLLFDQYKSSIPSKNGVTYLQYTLLFLYEDLNSEIVYRTMDIIEMDIQKKWDSQFHIRNCITGLEGRFNYTYQPLFFINTLPYRKSSIFHYDCYQSIGY